MSDSPRLKISEKEKFARNNRQLKCSRGYGKLYSKNPAGEEEGSDRLKKHKSIN
jgi:hypothetical protein